MVDRSQKVHQLGFKCVRIFTICLNGSSQFLSNCFTVLKLTGDSPMVDRSQKVHQLGFKCVRVFTHLFKW